METVDDGSKVGRLISYDRPESSVVFKIAWYAIASRPGVLLNEYSEAESHIFKGKAVFSAKVDEKPVGIRIWVEEAQMSAEVAVWGVEKAQAESYLDGVVATINGAIAKYNSLAEEERLRLRRALLAKTCWDRVVHGILSKAPVSSVYFQVAHGREMMIKATEGQEPLPTSFTTSTWLAMMDGLPKDQALPADMASELAKKSVEWRKDTQAFIARYL